MGLFLGTYVGYWLVGLAMLAIGMVASFLTGNLTIGFVLGVLFNAPLVLTCWPAAEFVSGSVRPAAASSEQAPAPQSMEPAARSSAISAAACSASPAPPTSS